ncbi:hypothetical protein RJG79_05325 [Mycoplasmatota bacterium WC44]
MKNFKHIRISIILFVIFIVIFLIHQAGYINFMWAGILLAILEIVALLSEKVLG